MFFTTRMDGALDVWDLFYKHNDPTLQVQVTDQPLTSIAMQESGSVSAAAGQRLPRAASVYNFLPCYAMLSVNQCWSPKLRWLDIALQAMQCHQIVGLD